LSVPDDISIITFNNSSYSTLIHPYLTTFDINITNLGRTRFRRLLELIKSPKTSITEKIIVPFILRERESVRQISGEELVYSNNMSTAFISVFALSDESFSYFFNKIS